MDGNEDVAVSAATVVGCELGGGWGDGSCWEVAVAVAVAVVDLLCFFSSLQKYFFR